MAVYKIKNGRWKAKINYRDDNGNIKTKEKIFGSRAEARSFEADYRRQIKSDTHEIDSIKYQEILDSYIASKKLLITEKTIKEKLRFVNKYWKHLLNKNYTNISKRDWMKVYDTIISTELSNAYKNKIIIALKAIAKYAYQYYDLNDNTKALKLLHLKKTIKYNFWELDELNLALDYVPNKTIKLLIKTLFFTGARRDELRLITKEEFDLSAKTLYLKDNDYRTLKNDASERIIRIHDELFYELKELVNHEGIFLFGGLEPITKTTLSRQFNEAIKQSGVKKIRLHDLRHSHATILINQGANIIAVSKRLGHSTTNQTLETYAHLMQKKEDELLKIIEEL